MKVDGVFSTVGKGFATVGPFWSVSYSQPTDAWHRKEGESSAIRTSATTLLVIETALELFRPRAGGGLDAVVEAADVAGDGEAGDTLDSNEGCECDGGFHCGVVESCDTGVLVGGQYENSKVWTGPDSKL